MRILIADDSTTARMFVRRCLEIVGFASAEILEAENGQEALAIAKKQATDLLITDLNMPLMDGKTLLKWVKANPRLNEIRVVVLSSISNPAKAEELLQLGAHAVLVKPLAPPALLGAIGDLLPKKEEDHGPLSW
ncbi:MAG: response regulator [Desulfobulbaceae bacterium A2]|nr:MAG: response regulator [Desulfobulbaceae bacterium A2]